MSKLLLMVLLGCLGLAAGCQTLPPIHTVEAVDLNRFMGDWHVIASIPTVFEKGAHNGIESYRLDDDGNVDTIFTFNKGGFDGPEKRYHSRGFVRDTGSGAVWDIQFVWPFKAEYRVIHLNSDYTQAVIGRTKRDYVWIMARTPSIPPGDYQRILRFLEDQGYDISAVQKVPQQKKVPS